LYLSVQLWRGLEAVKQRATLVAFGQTRARSPADWVLACTRNLNPIGFAGSFGLSQSESMNDQDEPETRDDELDDETLDQVAGGSGPIAQELTHTVQQASTVGANQTITIGANQTISVGTSPKR
jgi:hypothetical protein